MDALIFDEAMDRRYFDKVATYCYRPATDMFQALVEGGMKISLGFSVSLLLQMRRFGPDVLAKFQKLVSHENVELIAVEPYHSFIFYLDINAFAERMQWGKRQLEETFQKSISVTDTTEMFMSNDVYFQLQKSGFKGAVMDGRPWVMVWLRTESPLPLPGRGDAPLHPPLSALRRRRLSVQQPGMERLAADGRHLRQLGSPVDGRRHLPRLGLRDLRGAPPVRFGHLPLHARAARGFPAAQDELPHAVGSDHGVP